MSGMLSLSKSSLQASPRPSPAASTSRRRRKQSGWFAVRLSEASSHASRDAPQGGDRVRQPWPALEGPHAAPGCGLWGLSLDHQADLAACSPVVFHHDLSSPSCPRSSDLKQSSRSTKDYPWGRTIFFFLEASSDLSSEVVGGVGVCDGPRPRAARGGPWPRSGRSALSLTTPRTWQLPTLACVSADRFGKRRRYRVQLISRHVLETSRACPTGTGKRAHVRTPGSREHSCEPDPPPHVRGAA